MDKHNLQQARAYEAEAEKRIPDGERPVFHLTPRTGWMNDPNGFSVYGGRYHLFYQYYPYDTHWNAMHWGHAESEDLLQWTYRPAALAPDAPYDAFGCFSGSAVSLRDGRQLLMYTGVRKGEDGKEYQTQCLAVGDGTDYLKDPRNPVLSAEDLPQGLSPHDFRDPKILERREGDEGYHCVVAARRRDLRGVLLLYGSEDGLTWHFENVLAENDGRFGLMWECPDFFELDGRDVLFVSPQDMLPEGDAYHGGNGTVCQIGRWDRETGRFHMERHQTLDHGMDFYAPQTLKTPDGRRVMIGWMQNWDTLKTTGYPHRGWFGQMTVPRELTVRDGKLYQRPVRELEAHRGEAVVYRGVRISERRRLPQVEGRCAELELRLCPGSDCRRFTLRLAEDERFFTTLSLYPEGAGKGRLELDRSFSGSRRAYLHTRQCRVDLPEDGIRLRVILDRFSAEVFVNDGEQVMSAVILTDSDARGIAFEAEGEAVMDMTKYSLFGADRGI